MSFSHPIMTFHSAAILKRPRHHQNQEHSTRTKIRTLHELSQSGLVSGVVSGSHTEDLFRMSRDPMMTSLWTTMANSWPSAFVRSNEAGVQRARRENYAFISDSPKLEYASFQQPCIFYKSNNFLPKQHYALIVNQRDRDLKKVLDENLFHMHANGELSELKNKWWVNHCRDLPRRERIRNKQVVTPEVEELPRPSTTVHLGIDETQEFYAAKSEAVSLNSMWWFMYVIISVFMAV